MSFAFAAAILGGRMSNASKSMADYIAKARAAYHRDKNARRYARAADMAAMRPEKTYEEIGALYGMTRERVRQILRMHGFDDAIGRKNGPSISVAQHCEDCGRPHEVSRRASSEKWTCRRCIRKRRSKVFQLAPQMLAMRQAGAKWKDVAEAFGFPNPCTPQTLILRWLRKTGQADSAATGFYVGKNGNTRSHGREAAQ